jgi:hypothetical protein
MISARALAARISRSLMLRSTARLKACRLKSNRQSTAAGSTRGFSFVPTLGVAACLVGRQAHAVLDVVVDDEV